MKKVTKAVIPAAGLGTRVLPATKAMPKGMLPIVDKPAIQYLVEEAVKSGITDILIILGRNQSIIEDHFDRSPELEEKLAAPGKEKMLEECLGISNLANIFFVRQKQTLGLGQRFNRRVCHLPGRLARRHQKHPALPGPEIPQRAAHRLIRQNSVQAGTKDHIRIPAQCSIHRLALLAAVPAPPGQRTRNSRIKNQDRRSLLKSSVLFQSEWRESNSRPLEPHCAPLVDMLVKTAHNIRYITNFRIRFFILFRLMSRRFIPFVVKLWSNDPDK